MNILDNIKLDWDRLANCEEVSGLTDYEKVRVKDSFAFLKEELGADFIKNHFYAQHPLYFHIINRTAYSRIWVADFADNLKLFKHLPKYESLLKRLINPNTCKEALSVFEPATIFNNNGFNIEFDPPITVNGKPKMPDLKLIDDETKSILYCEVSTSNPSESQVKIEEAHMKLFFAIIRNPYNLKYAGYWQPKTLDVDIDEIELEIKNLSLSVAERKGFGKLIIPDIITLGLCLPGKENLLLQWAHNYNCYIGCFNGPEIPNNELQRIKIKIRNKCEQLPIDTPNIIWIHDTDFFYPIKDIIKTMGLIDSFSNFENILAVIIEGGYTGGKGLNIIHYDHHTFFQRQNKYMETLQSLIIWNAYCGFSVPAETKNKLNKSFLEYKIK